MAFAGGATGRAKEVDVPIGKVPKPVSAAVAARFPHAKVTDSSSEDETGKLLYELTVRYDGRRADVTVTPEGAIVLIEETIAAGALPPAVSQALEAKYPKAKYKIVESITSVEKGAETLTAYEVLLVTSGKQRREVELAPDGKILKEEDGDEDD